MYNWSFLNDYFFKIFIVKCVFRFDLYSLPAQGQRCYGMVIISNDTPPSQGLLEFKQNYYSILILNSIRNSSNKYIGREHLH